MINNFYLRIKDYLLKLPLLTWVLLGFFIPFLSFFVAPIFFDPSQSMQFKPYVLALTPIGYDFKAIVSFSSTWIHTGELVPFVYPAFTLLFFAPFTFLTNDTGYTVIVWIILLTYILVTWILPRRINKQIGGSMLAMLIGQIIAGWLFDHRYRQLGAVPDKPCGLLPFLALGEAGVEPATSRISEP